MYLGIDLGTSEVKAVVIDETGVLLALAGSTLTVSRPHPRWSEQSPADWWQATCATVDKLRAQALDILRDVSLKQPERLSTHDPVIGFTQFAASGITARVFLWVMPAHGISARTSLMIDIKKAFDAAGIEIPFPHQVEISKA